MARASRPCRVTHVLWCMSGSRTRSGGENVPSIPGTCAKRSFTYLIRGPLHNAVTISQIVKTIGSTSIRHRTDPNVWDRCLINVDLILLLEWNLILDISIVVAIVFRRGVKGSLCLWPQLMRDGVWFSLLGQFHNSDVMISTIASQITAVSIICSFVCSGAGQRKPQSSTSLAFVRGNHQWPVDSPHKGPVTRKMFPFHDGIMFAHWPWFVVCCLVVTVLSISWASCQIRKIEGYTCTGNAGNAFPATAS